MPTTDETASVIDAVISYWETDPRCWERADAIEWALEWVANGHEPNGEAAVAGLRVDFETAERGADDAAE